MADEKAKTPKRIVKNPETFRERAAKAADTPEKVKRTIRLRETGGKVTRPAGNFMAKVFSKPPFSWLARPLRLIGHVILPRYIRNSWRELRLVQWPSRHESLRLTRAVLIFATIFGVSVAALDYVLNKLFRSILIS